jgi:thiamine pyrophosphokinase
VRAAEVVLAADGGANHLARIGVRPTAVVGDLDSIEPSVRQWVGEERMVRRDDQEHTDLAKTLTYAFDECGATHVTVLAASAGRLDHALESLGVLARFAARGELELLDHEVRVVLVTDCASLATTPGQMLSLMPLGRCGRVWAEGVRWPLAGDPLDLAERTGISNVAEADRVELRVEGGTLLVFLEHEPDA